MNMTNRLLMACTAIALAACSSTPNGYSSNNSRLPGATTAASSSNAGVPMRSANATSAATSATTPTIAANNTKSAPSNALSGLSTRYITNEDLQEAAGRPIDPERPNAALILNGLDANSNLWDRVRLGFALPTLNSELVAEHERYYASRPDYVQRMTERGNRYLYHVLQEVQQRGMPSELALLPFIESAFNPGAMSSARASGIWQFMPATGRDFALKQNMFRDDRRDVLASTRAALDYLTRLNRQFGDWHLALAAYNWGEGNVQRAINKNLSLGLPTDYLSLNMPAETRNYVPKLHAVRNLVADPQRFGLRLTPIANHPYFLSVPIKRDIDVAVAVRLAEMSMDDFKALNPSMNKPVILAAGTPQILLPYDNTSLFLNNLKKYNGQLASWTAWVAPKTMKTAEAAKHVGISDSQLRELNRIPERMLVKAGSTLLVPRSEYREQDVSESIADNASMSLAPDVPPVKRLFLKAGKRDTVASIARRYRLPVAQVAQWNRLGANARFKRYQTVVVYVPVGSQLTAVADTSPRAKSGRNNMRMAKVVKGKSSATSAKYARSTAKNSRVVAKASTAARSKGRAVAENTRGKRIRVAMAAH
jgi:membrane-bound lytic murein transglycosylase D